MRKSLRSVSFIGALSVLIASIALPVVAFAAPIINEYPLADGSYPYVITSGPDGNIWFTEYSANKIGKINSDTGVITEYSPTDGSGPYGITSGPDGNLWFTEMSGNNIGKINPTTGEITEYSIQTFNPNPYGITSGPDGNLWFTEGSGNRIGKINPTTAEITEYTTPTDHSFPHGITPGPDGNIWFVESGNNNIGKINPTTAEITEYPIPADHASPEGITSGPNGNLWFVESGNNNIGKINPTTATPENPQITEYPLPDGSGPMVIISDLGGNIWFTEQAANKIATITTSGAVTEYSVPTSDSYPGGITAGPDGNIWFTETETSKIGKITVFPITGNTVTVAAGQDWHNLRFTVKNGITLVVDGILGDVTVEPGGILKGTGTVGNVTVDPGDPGGTIAPGHSPGCLGTGNLNQSGIFQVEIGGTTVCSEYSQIDVTGTVTIDAINSTLSPSLYNGFVPTVGRSYIIINNDGIDKVNGNFTGLSEGSTFTSQGVTYRITYEGGDGDNDVVLTVTNINSSQLPTVPNTGIHPNTTNPAIPILASLMTAGTLIYFSRRLTQKGLSK